MAQLRESTVEWKWMIEAMNQPFDIAFVGNYTKDTVVSAAGKRVVDGGAFNYGAHVSAAMGLRVAAVTRLAGEDWRVIEALEHLGVAVFAEDTPESTCLRLEYPSTNVDERVLYVTSMAGALVRQQVAGVQAGLFVICASLRGEVPLETIDAIAVKGARIAADVQGFVRAARGGILVYEDWPEREAVLAQVEVLKTDAVEAEMLTGETDIYTAARRLAELGPKEIVLTHRDGLLVYAGGQDYETGFFPVELVGRSGRGDTCLAAYVSKRLSASPAEATIWAAAVTSLKLEAEGPFRREIGEVEALIQQRYGTFSLG
jgi:sugar/nucleoside kinase (ribokinase family)